MRFGRLVGAKSRRLTARKREKQEGGALRQSSGQASPSPKAPASDPSASLGAGGGRYEDRRPVLANWSTWWKCSILDRHEFSVAIWSGNESVKDCARADRGFCCGVVDV